MSLHLKPKTNTHRSFDETYEVILADTEASRVIHRKIRYQVYCVEQQFEDPAFFPFGEESDRWDVHAAPFIVRQRYSESWVAALRLVLPYAASFPLETLRCLAPGQADHIGRRNLAEISRVCVIRSPDPWARNRYLDRKFGHVGGDRDSQVLLGLIRAFVIYGLQRGIEYCYLLVTPAFARLLKRLGIVLHQVGIPVDHRGLRVPYLLGLREMMESLCKNSALANNLFACPERAYRPYSALGYPVYAPSYDSLPPSLPGHYDGADDYPYRRWNRPF